MVRSCLDLQYLVAIGSCPPSLAELRVSRRCSLIKSCLVTYSKENPVNGTSTSVEPAIGDRRVDLLDRLGNRAEEKIGALLWGVSTTFIHRCRLILRLVEINLKRYLFLGF